MNLRFDASDAVRVFRAYPEAAVAKLNELIRGGAIDVQREIRTNAPIHDGQLRRTVMFRTNPGNFSAEIWPDAKYAPAVENGSRPHWVSVKEGSPLRKWADDHGISPYAVQNSIAQKGTKANPFVHDTYMTMKPRVENDIDAGFGRFVGAVNEGRI